MVEALSHITFIVRDLQQMSHFLTTLFDAKEIHSSEKRGTPISKEKFFLINDIWIAIIEGETLVEKTYNHVAFRVAEADFEKYVQRVRSAGVEILEDRKRTDNEGKSLYFYDYDNHLFEIHTGTLEQRLESFTDRVII